MAAGEEAFARSGLQSSSHGRDDFSPQVYIPDDFVEQLEYQVDCLSFPHEPKLPLDLRWPERRLSISVLPNDSPDLQEPLPPPTPSPAPAPTLPFFPLAPNPFL